MKEAKQIIRDYSLSVMRLGDDGMCGLIHFDNGDLRFIFSWGGGWLEANDVDPLWYGFDEIIPCTSCGGSGLVKDMRYC
jgi:hypothetical protein